MRNNIYRRFIIVAVIAAIVLVVLAAGAFVSALPTGPECNPCTGYTIVLQQATHIGNEPGFDDVLWEYLITADEDSKNISHVSVIVPSCYKVIDCGPTPCERGLDPTTGIDGVKWDVELLAGGSAVYWFVTRAADGETRHGDIEAAIKAGQNICDYSVDGPVCDPTAVSFISLTATQKDNAVWLAIAIAIMFGAAVVVLAWVYRRIE